MGVSPMLSFFENFRHAFAPSESSRSPAKLASSPLLSYPPSTNPCPNPPSISSPRHPFPRPPQPLPPTPQPSPNPPSISHPPPPLPAPPPAPKKLSPAMRQYRQFKEQYPDYCLFFRMGDFYEMFWDDAKVANRVLGVALTSR